MQRYIVLGGGLAGLTAANALAGDGHKVVLLEQSQHLGGRAITQPDRGYLLNLGPHALFAGGVAAQTLRQWNVPFSGRPPDTSSASFLMYDGRMYPLILTTRQLLATRLFGAAEKWQAARLLQQLVSGRAAAGESMEEWIDRRARRPRVRQFAAMLVRLSTYSADLAQLSARAALDQFRRAISPGVLYLDGGWQTLVDGLEQRARALGVEIRLGEAVESLESLRAAIRADGVILAVPPASVERLTGRSLPGMNPARLACLDLGLRTLPAGAARVTFGVDQPLYLSVHSAVAKLAPAGAALVHVGKYLARATNTVTDAAGDRQELEQFADSAIPGWRDQAEVVRFMPNMTVTPAVFSPQGRPGVDALGLPGVALAGDWVGSEGMLADAAVASALHAAAMVQRQENAARTQTDAARTQTNAARAQTNAARAQTNTARAQTAGPTLVA
jgi:phytoene dehydrogenase-like protein